MVSSESTSGGRRGILDEAQRQREVKEVDKSVQTENTLHEPIRNVCVEMLSGSRAQHSPWNRTDMHCFLKGSDSKEQCVYLLLKPKSIQTCFIKTNFLRIYNKPFYKHTKR